MSVSYFKRFRMEIDLRGSIFLQNQFAPPGYRLLAWRPDQLAEHAEAKYTASATKSTPTFSPAWAIRKAAIG